MNCSCLICLKPMERGGNMACTGLELFGVCPSCLADARLGRLLGRGLMVGDNIAIERRKNGFLVNGFVVNRPPFAFGREDNTILAALIAAGVKEGEG